MMYRVAKFYKVPFDKFKEAWMDEFPDFDEEATEAVWKSIKLPKRATAGSMGYDFFAPIPITLKPGETIKMPTGVGISFVEDGWGLFCLPRSGLGFKCRLQLDNTVGVIDADYEFAENGGHIFEKITCDSKTNKTVMVNQGDGFVQGIILPYGITLDDDCTAERTGGMGSTTGKV